MIYQAGQASQPAPQAQLKVARHGALAECRVNNQAPQSPAGTAESFSQGNHPMPFQNHLEFIIKTLPGMMLRLITDIERHGRNSVVPAGLSSRVEQVPGTPLTLRAGLLSGRAYLHSVYKLTAESL